MSDSEKQRLPLGRVSEHVCTTNSLIYSTHCHYHAVYTSPNDDVMVNSSPGSKLCAVQTHAVAEHFRSGTQQQTMDVHTSNSTLNYTSSPFPSRSFTTPPLLTHGACAPRFPSTISSACIPLSLSTPAFLSTLTVSSTTPTSTPAVLFENTTVFNHSLASLSL